MPPPPGLRDTYEESGERQEAGDRVGWQQASGTERGWRTGGPGVSTVLQLLSGSGIPTFHRLSGSIQVTDEHLPSAKALPRAQL